MQVKIGQHELSKALGTLIRASSGKTTIPSLSHILFIATGDGVVARSTDLEIAYTLPLAAEVKIPGFALLPAKRLVSYIGSLPDGTVEIKESTQGNYMVSCGKSRARIPGLEVSSFPDDPPAPRCVPIALPCGLLARMIRSTIMAICDVESRFTLNGCLLELEGDAGRMRMVATDGHRLALHEARYNSGAHRRLIIPRVALVELVKLCSDAPVGGECIFADDANMLHFTVGETKLIARRIDGTFPDYRRVLPQGELPGSRIVSREELAACIGRVGQFADEKTRSMRLVAQNGSIKLSASTLERGDLEEEIAVEGNEHEIDTGICSKYVAEFLAACSSEKVEMKFQSPDNAVIFSPVIGSDAECMLNLIMPMRI